MPRQPVLERERGWALRALEWPVVHVHRLHMLSLVTLLAETFVAQVALERPLLLVY